MSHHARSMEPREQELISGIKAGNHTLVDQLYEDYRPAFVQWLNQHFKALEHEAVDIFQDALIIFYRNITSGKVDRLNSSIKTYLFAIGKHLWLKRFRKKQRISFLEELPDISYEGWDTQIIRDIESADQRARLEAALNQLGDKCKRLLVLAFFHRYSTEALQHEFDYNSADVVRTKKYRCLNQLRALLKPNEMDHE